VITPLIAGLISFFALFFMSNVFNLQVSQNPSKFVKGDVIEAESAKEFNQEKDIIVDHFDRIESEIRTVELYKPAVVIILIILLGVIFYQLYIISKLKEKDKLDENEENLKKYNAQHALLENEIKMINDSKLKLEKEIEEKEKQQKKIALGIIRKNEILVKLKGEIEKIKSKPEKTLRHADLNSLKLLILDNLNVEKERKSLDKYMKELNENFFRNLEINYPGLTESEKKLCSLLRLKLSSKEIASILNISPKSVEVGRYRLRKKMGVSKNEKLSKVIRKL